MTELGKLIEAVEAGTMAHDGNAYRLFGDGWLHVFDAMNGSIDAAKALHDALLPGWFPVLSQNVHHGYWYACMQTGSAHHEAVENTPARAWLLAILRAYRATKEQEQ